VAEIKTGTVGDFDLTVAAQGQGAAAAGGAGHRAHRAAAVSTRPIPGAAAPGTLVTLAGSWGPETFGHKPGKVKVGGKPAVVTDWQPDAVVFEMPSKLADGLYVVEASNKIGQLHGDRHGGRRAVVPADGRQRLRRGRPRPLLLQGQRQEVQVHGRLPRSARVST